MLSQLIRELRKIVKFWIKKIAEEIDYANYAKIYK